LTGLRVHNLTEVQGTTGTQKKTQEILRHLGTQKGGNVCLKCTKIHLAARTCCGGKVAELWRKDCEKDES